jgi:hypothetical protein
MLDAKIADTNAPAVASQIVIRLQLANHLLSKSVFLDLFHLRPTCGDVGYCQARRVNQVKVNVRYPELCSGKCHESTG